MDIDERTFSADRDGMVACQEFLASICESPRPQVIMDEIVSNIVRCSGAKEFKVRFEHKYPDGVVSMTFIDAGKPFDPTREVAEPDLKADVADRNIGGLGIFMVKKMSKSIAYRREGDKNILSVTL